MRIIAITTFPPSQNVLSSFGHQCIKGFLSIPEIQEVLILSDRTFQKGETLKHEKIIIDRCWKPNSLLTLIRIIYKVRQYSPDIVWVNLQYTLFGPSLVSSFLGLFIIPLLRLMGYPVVTILHNYYGAINISKLGMRKEKLIMYSMMIIDPIIMRAIIASNKIFVMSREYLYDLKNRYPSADVEYTEQDLWDVPSYRPVNHMTKNILTFGCFGTYKKLEPLLDVFPEIQAAFPVSQLIIAGKNHPQTPNYLDKVFLKYPNHTGIIYKGYIQNNDLDKLFWDSNVVVLTNSVVTGSSTVLRFASCFGRGIIVPSVDEYDGLDDWLWGIKKYKEGDREKLLENILTVLSNIDLQVALSKKNYNQALLVKNNFISAHKDAFKKLSCIKQKNEP
jgi:glycosyltransferase involved in cell wall biosynthesis